MLERTTMIVHIGETYGKRKEDGRFALYTVLGEKKGVLTLQNIDHPESAFETTAAKLEQSGYELVSQAPYIPTVKAKKRALRRQPNRCPYTLDFIEGRADCDKPVPRSAEA